MYNVLLLGDVNLAQRSWQIKKIGGLSELEQNELMKYDFVLIDNMDAGVTLKYISELRQNYNYFGAIGTIGNESQYANFHYSERLELTSLLESIERRIKLITDGGSVNEVRAVIKYLFIFQDSGLQLIQQIKNDKIYHTVIEDIFNIGRSSFMDLMDELKDVGLIESKEYVDSALSCNACTSELLKFNDICPSCYSSNVVNSKFIHCFKCGHVESEVKFTSKDYQLICPNCRQKLLLIGDDYDRPLDTTKCLNCNEIFIDGDIKIECLSCHHVHNDTNQLWKSYYFNYILRKDSDELFISYFKEEILYLFDKLNYTSKEYFDQLLKWMLMLFKRHKDEDFNIVKLDLNLAASEINLRALAEQFKNVLRTTDLYCRIGLTRILILFPKTTDESGAILLDRIAKIVDSVVGAEGQDSIKINRHTATQIIALDLNTIWFK